MHYSFDGGDDDQNANPITTNPEDKGGPEAGMYGSEDPNMPIPGEDDTVEGHQ